jgi:hypothetical protein
VITRDVRWSLSGTDVELVKVMFPPLALITSFPARSVDEGRFATPVIPNVAVEDA